MSNKPKHETLLRGGERGQAPQPLEVAIDQLIFARQSEWSGWLGHDKLKLRDLIVETVRPYVRGTS